MKSFSNFSLEYAIISICDVSDNCFYSFFGGRMILNGTMQAGELTGFLSYVLQILNALNFK